MDDKSITFLHVTNVFSHQYEAHMNINFQTITGQKTGGDKILSGMEAEERIVSGPSRSDSVNKDSYLFNLDGTGFTKSLSSYIPPNTFPR